MVGKAIKDTQASSCFLSFFFFLSFPGYLGGTIYVRGCNLKLKTPLGWKSKPAELNHKYCLVTAGLPENHRSIIKSNGKGLGILVGEFLWVIEVLLQSFYQGLCALIYSYICNLRTPWEFFRTCTYVDNKSQPWDY